jgi:TnpA family transposase
VTCLFVRYCALRSEPLIGARIDTKLIFRHWEDLLRLATSIKQGTVTASTILRKLAAYPRQNRLATALRELGRFERTIFTLDFLRDIELRRRIQPGLNKGEARNALARAVFFNRLGELRGEPTRTNSTGQMASAWLLPRLCSGTRSTWEKPSRSLSDSVETFPKSCWPISHH